MNRPSARQLLRHVPVLHFDQHVGEAVRAIAEAAVPALPVADDRGRFYGIFGEREFIAALFPGYLGLLKYAGFVPSSLDTEIYRRIACLDEHIAVHTNREHVEIREGYSDTQLAETFLHHRVLIAPVVDREQQVVGIVTRSDFFAALAAGVARPDGT